MKDTIMYLSVMTAQRALERGLRILELVAAQPSGISHGACVRVLALPNTTISRLLQGLITLGYLRKDVADGLYKPGERLGALGAQESDEMRLRRVGLPALRELSAVCCCSGLLLRWTGQHTICLERTLVEDSVVLQPPGHVTQNLFHSPWGMFFLDGERWRAALRSDRLQLRRLGLTRKAYEREQRRLRDDGFAICNASGKQRVAAPLRDGAGVCLGALVLGGSEAGLPDRRIVAEVGPRLAAAARMCCRDLAI